MWILGRYRIVFEIMDYGSHGKDRAKYRMDLNRALFLQSQECRVISISFDEMKENPLFLQAMLHTILAPYFASTEQNGTILHKFVKIERQLMRLAIRHNRMVSPSVAAKELELHKQTIIKYCRQLVEKGKLRAVPPGRSGKIYYYEYIGTIQSPDLI